MSARDKVLMNLEILETPGILEGKLPKGWSISSQVDPFRYMFSLDVNGTPIIGINYKPQDKLSSTTTVRKGFEPREDAILERLWVGMEAAIAEQRALKEKEVLEFRNRMMRDFVPQGGSLPETGHPDFSLIFSSSTSKDIQGRLPEGWALERSDLLPNKVLLTLDEKRLLKIDLSFRGGEKQIRAQAYHPAEEQDMPMLLGTLAHHAAEIQKERESIHQEKFEKMRSEIVAAICDKSDRPDYGRDMSITEARAFLQDNFEEIKGTRDLDLFLQKSWSVGYGYNDLNQSWKADVLIKGVKVLSLEMKPPRFLFGSPKFTCEVNEFFQDFEGAILCSLAESLRSVMEMRSNIRRKSATHLEHAIRRDISGMISDDLSVDKAKEAIFWHFELLRGEGVNEKLPGRWHKFNSASGITISLEETGSALTVNLTPRGSISILPQNGAVNDSQEVQDAMIRVLGAVALELHQEHLQKLAREDELLLAQIDRDLAPEADAPDLA